MYNDHNTKSNTNDVKNKINLIITFLHIIGQHRVTKQTKHEAVAYIDDSEQPLFLPSMIRVIHVH